MKTTREREREKERERRRDMHAPIHALFAEKISRMHS